MITQVETPSKVALLGFFDSLASTINTGPPISFLDHDRGGDSLLLLSQALSFFPSHLYWIY
jgi:hypothetical protein